MLADGSVRDLGPDDELFDAARVSLGALGVITRAALRVHPLPEAQRFEGWFAPDFEAGCEALRRLEHESVSINR